MMFELPNVDHIVARALSEDLGVDPEWFSPSVQPAPNILSRDATSSSTIDPDTRFDAVVVAREECVVCGLPVAERVFEEVSHAAGLFEPVEFFPLVAEGARVAPGTEVAEVSGIAQAVLASERTALNFMMVLSGIATVTAQWVELAGDNLAVCDTRKTYPGLRSLSKYAVRVGGGTNHRHGLFDMVLVKDNHRREAGGITAAVGRARLRQPALEVEVEADTVEQAVEAVRAGADLVLLDNMSDDMLVEAVHAARQAAEKRGAPVLLEVSGGVVRSRVPVLRLSGVDRVSSSALTMACPVDFGLDER